MAPSTTQFTQKPSKTAFLFFRAGGQCLRIVTAARGLRPTTTAALVVGIGFAAVEGAGDGLASSAFVFFGLEAAGEGFVGFACVGGGEGVFFGGVGTFVVAAGVGGRTVRECDCRFGGDFVLGFAGYGVYVVAGWVRYEFSCVDDERREGENCMMRGGSDLI